MSIKSAKRDFLEAGKGKLQVAILLNGDYKVTAGSLALRVLASKECSGLRSLGA